MPTKPPNPVRLLTGEVLETGQTVIVEQPQRLGKTKARKKKRMSMINVDAMTRLELTTREARVFWNLVSHVPSRSGSVAFVLIGQIADETGIHRVAVSQIMRDLRDRRIVTTLRLGQHQINANIVYNGSFDDWNDADVLELDPIWRRHEVDPLTGEVK